jgi:hypothetical protein
LQLQSGSLVLEHDDLSEEINAIHKARRRSLFQPNVVSSPSAMMIESERSAGSLVADPIMTLSLPLMTAACVGTECSIENASR